MKSKEARQETRRLYDRKYSSIKRLYNRCSARVAKAIEDGVLNPPSVCERCGNSNGKVVAHHHDYSRPLDVAWLCYSCHRQEHGKMKTDLPKVYENLKTLEQALTEVDIMLEQNEAEHEDLRVKKKKFTNAIVSLRLMLHFLTKGGVQWPPRETKIKIRQPQLSPDDVEDF